MVALLCHWLFWAYLLLYYWFARRVRFKRRAVRHLIGKIVLLHLERFSTLLFWALSSLSGRERRNSRSIFTILRLMATLRRLWASDALIFCQGWSDFDVSELLQRQALASYQAVEVIFISLLINLHSWNNSVRLGSFLAVSEVDALAIGWWRCRDLKPLLAL